MNLPYNLVKNIVWNLLIILIELNKKNNKEQTLSGHDYTKNTTYHKHELMLQIYNKSINQGFDLSKYHNTITRY